MAKKSKTQTAAVNFKLKALFILLLLGVLVVCIFTYIFAARDAQKEAPVLIISQLIVNAAEGTKTPAPVDPKTGDIYFPQAGLFLPKQPDTSLQFTYQYNPEGWTEGDGPTLAISTKSIFNQSAVNIISSTSSDEVFKYVPKMQACQRGVHFEYVKHSEGDQPIHTIRLNNGKDLFMYTEPSCPELGELHEVLKAIQAY